MDQEQVYDASLDAEMEKRNQITYIRDNSESIIVGDKKVGKITAYKFKILIRDKEALVGELSREEMDLVYKLYASEGSNLQQRSVSRFFPTYTFQDFKRILRAFNITKASSPMAPHVIEEKTTEELIQLTLQSKENDYLRKLEQDRVKFTENSLKDMTKKYYDLKQRAADFTDFLSGLKFNVEVKHITDVKIPPSFTKGTIIAYVSDMHIGADVSEYSIYKNKFSFEEANRRAELIFDRIIDNFILTGASNVVITNLGDCLDGYNGETTRGGHLLPQNMNNKDQYKFFIQIMLNLIANIQESGFFDSIKYVSVDGGNHDGDFGWMANKSLEACLSVMHPNVNVQIFDKYIDHITVDNHTFVFCHGKDAKDVFKNMPLTINDKIENQINEYLDYHDIKGTPDTIHFIKGDLHQSATTYAKRFKYRSVSSFFGSSEWIHKNFGNTKAAIDFDIVVENRTLQDRLILN